MTTVQIRPRGDMEPLGGKDMPDVICPCGWKGNGTELLYSPAQNERIPEGLQLPFYCPQCHRNGWEGWEWV